MGKAQKVALVTGASRGIGRAVALRLAADGFAVAVNYTANAKAADEVVSAIAAKGGRAVAVKANVADTKAVAQMFDQVEEALGPVDAVVNNAGVMSLATVAESTDEAYEQMFSVNTKGTFNMLREAARRMPSGGRIVNVSTSVVGFKLPTYSLYAASKAAVETFTAILCRELRGRNITVNAVAPGPTATDLFLEGKTPERIEQLAKMAPLERVGQPEEIASAVSFLVGPDGSWVNGQTLRLNGGAI